MNSRLTRYQCPPKDVYQLRAPRHVRMVFLLEATASKQGKKFELLLLACLGMDRPSWCGKEVQAGLNFFDEWCPISGVIVVSGR